MFNFALKCNYFLTENVVNAQGAAITFDASVVSTNALYIKVINLSIS